MAGTATPIYLQSVKNAAVQILPADTTTLKTIITPGVNGVKVESIHITSTDTSAKDVQLVVTKGGVDCPLCVVQITARSGDTNAIAAINLLQSSMILSQLPKDVNGNPYLYLESGSVLKAKAQANVTTAKAISIFATYGEF